MKNNHNSISQNGHVNNDSPFSNGDESLDAIINSYRAICHESVLSANIARIMPFLARLPIDTLWFMMRIVRGFVFKPEGSSIEERDRQRVMAAIVRKLKQPHVWNAHKKLFFIAAIGEFDSMGIAIDVEFQFNSTVADHDISRFWRNEDAIRYSLSQISDESIIKRIQRKSRKLATKLLGLRTFFFEFSELYNNPIIFDFIDDAYRDGCQFHEYEDIIKVCAWDIMEEVVWVQFFIQGIFAGDNPATEDELERLCANGGFEVEEEEHDGGVKTYIRMISRSEKKARQRSERRR